MRLYATITSERATKGQGGNKYLDIYINNEQKEEIGYIRVQNEGEKIRFHIVINGEDITRYIAKAKRQKGEHCKEHNLINCSNCS